MLLPPVEFFFNEGPINGEITWWDIADAIFCGILKAPATDIVGLFTAAVFILCFSYSLKFEFSGDWLS